MGVVAACILSLGDNIRLVMLLWTRFLLLQLLDLGRFEVINDSELGQRRLDCITDR